MVSPDQHPGGTSPRDVLATITSFRFLLEAFLPPGSLLIVSPLVVTSDKDWASCPHRSRLQLIHAYGNDRSVHGRSVATTYGRRLIPSVSAFPTPKTRQEAGRGVGMTSC
jgi:hypothetical protein